MPRSVLLIAFLLPFLSLSCDGISNTLRNWGERQRWSRTQDLREADLKQWQTDLKVSREEAQELNDRIQSLVKESTLQGNLSWKIARAYMDAGQYEMASLHYEGAMEGRSLPPEVPEDRRLDFLDQAVSRYEEALLRHKPEAQLLYEAGLCYANSSRERGWEVRRWQRAVLLFDMMRNLKPDDTRPLYQLALLYGKTTRSSLRNVDFALELLDDVIAREDLNIAARFARANIQVENGKLDEARAGYGAIMEKLEDMHRSGMLSGSVKSDSSYRAARENAEKLDICIQNLPGCEIRR